MTYLSLHFLLYLGRWILSAFVMMVPLYLLNRYSITSGRFKEYMDLVIVQIVGAFIFYFIDAYIFSS